MPMRSALSCQYFHEAEILYDCDWASTTQDSAVRIAGALNLPSTQEINALWYDNAETRRIIKMWSDFVEKEQRFVGLGTVWQQATMFMDTMTAPVSPQIDVQDVTRKIFPFVFASWCTTRLMRLAPRLFSRSNLDTTPPELDAYDVFHALCILCSGDSMQRSRESQSLPTQSPRVARPVEWRREPRTDRLHIPPPLSLNAIEKPATELASTTARQPEHALPVASGGDNIGPPKEGAVSSYTGTREMLYQFAGRLCEQFQRVQLSVESDEAEKDGNGSTQFAGIDELVEQYTKSIRRRCIRDITTHSQPF